MSEDPLARINDFTRGMYFDRQGQEIDFSTYVRLHADKSYQWLVKTEVAPDVLVSTVWLGLNHNTFSTGLLIFETMVFGAEDEDADEYVDHYREQYATEAQAIAGHDQIVAMVREKVST